ncbi:NAD(P)H-hydrate epimerase [Malassezia nana]|uniref:NAD(P)H-hydrate epimerase n=1 Tax=Malassezia nana TaxID=180528 RepID=A0AAF0EKM9_9BASI|nr:NAD(P)H-hydrate epimerase [Malassezia nana]
MLLRYLTSAVAQQIDRELMSPAGGFSIDQLMELAGLSCAEAVFQSYPPVQGYQRVLVACGPGNQGGDGLVAARHLKHFGYDPLVWYPKRKEAPLFQGLEQQLKNLNIEFVPQDHFTLETVSASDIVLDAIFGFSFKGEPRDPFKSALEHMITAQKGASSVPIVSVDIPSSWNVDLGPNTSDIAQKFMPNVLVSLTAPKSGSQFFRGKHWLGGRFVDAALDAKYDLRLPAYPGVSQIVDITEASPLKE